MTPELHLSIAELVERVLSSLTDRGYSERYINRMSRIYNKLLAYCEGSGESSYSTILGERFLSACYPIQPGNNEELWSYQHRAIDMLADFQNFGSIVIRHKSGHDFPDNLKAVAESYLQYLKDCGFRENTINHHKTVILRFTDYMDSLDIGYESLTVSIVSDFIKGNMCYDAISSVVRYYRMLCRYLQYLAQHGHTDDDLSQKMVSVNRAADPVRLPTTLTLDQINSILASVDRHNPQGKRDYAVLMIAAKLGIRTCDIRNLKPKNIDWDKHTVSFVQIKNGEPLTLPLPTDVGWAIIDYLKNGRPESKTPEIFLRAAAPYESLKNFDNILIKYMRRAGIPLESVKHHGLHTLRHSLASHMLEEEIPITSIQSVLGHVSAVSTQRYISINVHQLRACALEVID